MFKTLRKTQQLWITSKRNCLKNDEKKKTTQKNKKPNDNNLTAISQKNGWNF